MIHALCLVEPRDTDAGTRVGAWRTSCRAPPSARTAPSRGRCYTKSGAVIGDRVILKDGTSVWSGVTPEADVFVGPAVVFTSDLRPRSPRSEHVDARYGDIDSRLVLTHVGRGAARGSAPWRRNPMRHVRCTAGVDWRVIAEDDA
jgi:UDP-2-acetamido-3-amino-2,3-dideoxy-glucuronate N-acetyltransferase